MTRQTADGEEMREIASLAGDVSPTAASAENRIYGTSGEMNYRCVFRDGGFVDVKAATGDAAALAALATGRGSFVTSINPAPAN